MKQSVPFFSVISRPIPPARHGHTPHCFPHHRMPYDSETSVADMVHKARDAVTQSGDLQKPCRRLPPSRFRTKCEKKCAQSRGPALGSVTSSSARRIRMGGAGYKGLTLVHFPAQREPFSSHFPVSSCLIDWGQIMHPTCPTKSAYVEPKIGRV
jgi:hypothetical protein